MLIGAPVASGTIAISGETLCGRSITWSSRIFAPCDLASSRATAAAWLADEEKSWGTRIVFQIMGASLLQRRQAPRPGEQLILGARQQHVDRACGRIERADQLGEPGLVHRRAADGGRCRAAPHVKEDAATVAAD